jgi:hypothetical protein
MIIPPHFFVSFHQDGGEDYDTMKHTLRDVLLDIDKLQVPPPPPPSQHLTHRLQPAFTDRVAPWSHDG